MCPSQSMIIARGTIPPFASERIGRDGMPAIREL
jgi:hypothetical protein